MNLSPRLVGAVLGSLAAFGVAGTSFAGAQETPTTEAPAAETPAPPAPDPTAPDGARPDREDCEDKGGTSSSAAPGADTTSL